MSLAIDIDHVTGVLLADGWHTVDNASFGLDSYEYVWAKGLGDGRLLFGGDGRITPTIGFHFTDTEGAEVCGPVTSILAVKRVTAPSSPTRSR